MRATEWVALACDINAVAAKLIQLRTLYPNADGECL